MYCSVERKVEEIVNIAAIAVSRCTRDGSPGEANCELPDGEKGKKYQRGR